jgi:hypothetical protein
MEELEKGVITPSMIVSVYILMQLDFRNKQINNISYF